MRMRKLGPFTLAAAGLIALALGNVSCGDRGLGTGALFQDDVMSELNQSGDFDTMVMALRQTGLDQTLSRGGPYTVFAPTDAAFDKLPPGMLNNLLLPENRARLTEMLRHHVVSGEYTGAEVAAQNDLPVLSGRRLMIYEQNGTLFVSGSRVTESNIQASNGVIHAIDTVLLP